MKSAIVVVTRGYKNLYEYNALIQRNKSIYDKFYKHLVNPKNWDILIFHEGDIRPNQQKYIQTKTPHLPLIFRIFRQYPLKYNYKLCPPTEKSEIIPIGYKNMCFFWVVSMFTYLSHYEYMIRIDEDCVLHQFDPTIIDDYRKKKVYFSSPIYQSTMYVEELDKNYPLFESPECMIGMKQFFYHEYIKNLNKKPYVYNVTKAPYTNLMIMNIPYFLHHKDIQYLIRKIRYNDCIFSNRWGDLPIWGFILAYAVHPKHYGMDRRIKYFHGSHDYMVNE